MSNNTLPWHQRPDIWKAAHAHIKDELREFMLLSPEDVRALTQEAARAADPGRRLADLLNERALKKKQIRDAHYQERMKHDAEKIRDVASWPMNHLPLKTQPWITNAERRMRFALIHCSDILTVIEEGKAPMKFESVEEIVKTWSVD